MANPVCYDTCHKIDNFYNCFLLPSTSISTGNDVTFSIKLYPGIDPYLSNGVYIGLVTNYTQDDTIQFIFNAKTSIFTVISPNVNNHILSLNPDFNPVLTCGSTSFKNNEFLMSIYQRLA